MFIRLFDKRKRVKKSDFWALKDVTFSVNKGDVVGNFEPDMANYDWYCMQLADTFTTSEFDCEYETDDTLNAKKINITLPNGITIQGLTNPWRKPTCTGCDYSFKNILVDIDKIDKYFGYIVPVKGEGHYKTVNLKYKNQIICRQKDT